MAVVTDEMRERLTQEITDQFGAPLGTSRIEELLKTPYSQMHQAMAAFVSIEQQKVMAQQYAHVMSLWDRLKGLMRHSAEEVVGGMDDDDVAQVVPQNPVQKPDLDVEMPDEVKNLQAELNQLQTAQRTLCETLGNNKTAQRNDFNAALPTLTFELRISKLDEAKQEEFIKMYEEKMKGPDEIAKMAGKEFSPEQRETLEKAVDHKAELALAKELLPAQKDEAGNVIEDANLKPSQVKELGQKLGGRFVKQLGENHRLANEIKDLDGKIAQKAGELVHAVEKAIEKPEHTVGAKHTLKQEGENRPTSITPTSPTSTKLSR